MDNWLDDTNWVREHPIISILIVVIATFLIFNLFNDEREDYDSQVTGRLTETSEKVYSESKLLDENISDKDSSDNNIRSENLSESNIYSLEIEENISIIEMQDSSSDDAILASKIIDGDTIKLSNGNTVRLICIDTPERGQNYYEESANYLSTLILGKRLILEKDISEVDKYERLLRYIYVDEIFVNKELVLKGYAEAYPYAPDTKHCPEIIEAENIARENKLGIWNENFKVDYSNISECQCEEDLDCKDFKSQRKSQECFDYCIIEKGYDFHRLDDDKDNKACESLP